MKIDHEICGLCGTCVAVCPVDAIRVTEFRVYIDLNTCIECGKCETICPFKAISGGQS